MWAKGLQGRPPCVKLKEELRDWGRAHFHFLSYPLSTALYRKTGLLWVAGY